MKPVDLTEDLFFLIKSCLVIQKRGDITVEAARLRKKEKNQKKLTAVKRIQKDIQVAINKTKAALKC